MRKYGRTDSNQAELIRHAAALGASCVSLTPMGGGCPDYLIGHRGATYLVEIKGLRGQLTPDQRQFIRDWQGSHVHVLRTTEDVERLLIGLKLGVDKLSG